MCNTTLSLACNVLFRGDYYSLAHKAHPVPLLVFQDRIDKVDFRAK